MAESSRSERTWLARLVPWLVIGGLVLFHAVNNWIWLVENVTWTGWDRTRHLAWSLNYASMLSPFTVHSLFNVMTADPIRTPFFAASAAVLYGPFGRSADVATMINVVYMGIALAATYGIGQRWGGRWLGLVSAVLLTFFPMFYSTSRHFYIEFALTAMVALAVYLLLATDGFQRRGMSLLFGLSLGLGLLTKRTFVVFAVGPVMAVILTSGLLPALWQRLKRRPRIYWKNALIALAGGLAAAALWYLPNREAARGLILGDSLFFFWWMLAALALYFATLPSAPLSNALAAFFLAAGLASLWYLAHPDFLRRMALYGYGIDDPRGRALRLDSLDTYLYYLRKLGNEHLSFFVLVLLVVVLIVALFVYVRRQASLRQALRQVRPEGWVVLAWAVGAYVLLTFSIYEETRAFTPILPAVALLFGWALLKLPWRRLRLAVLAVVLLFGLLQFFAISYEPVYRLLPPVAFRLPVWGPTTSFAQGNLIQLPDEGDTDRGYWIEPDVLQRMEQRRQALGRELLSLDLLVNTDQINAGQFNYLMLTEYPHLRIGGLTEGADESSLSHSLYAHEYVAIKRLNKYLDPEQEQAIEAIFDNPPPLFLQLYELETTYLLPDGQSVVLYRQRYLLPADYPAEYIDHLAGVLGERTRSGDAILVTPAELAAPFAAQYAGPAEIYVAPAAEAELADIAARHRRLFLVLGDPAAGEAEGLAQDWLSQNAFLASHEWSDSMQLLTYGTTAEAPPTSPTVPVNATFDGSIELSGYAPSEGLWRPGDIVPLTLFWTSRGPLDKDYQVFLHLLDGSGQLVAQTDSAPVGGMRPTSSWSEGEQIVDRHGLLLPSDLPAGKYELHAGLYLPATGDRLPVQDAAGNPPGDSLSLGQLEIAAP